MPRKATPKPAAPAAPVSAPHAAPATVPASAAAVNTAPSLDAPIVQSLVVFAKSMAKVSAFYQRTLGLLVVQRDSGHRLLRGRGIELVVHAIPRKYASSITIAKPPVPREETPFKPAFVVADLAAVRVAVEATGGFLKPIDRAWHFRGATVLDGWDPEGNIVQFKQPDPA